MRHALTIAVSALVGLTLAGCTSDQEASPPAEPPVAASDEGGGPLGAEVAILLPSEGSLDPLTAQAVAAALEPLSSRPPDGISELRLHTPDSTTFARDLARTFGERGMDLVCAVGSDALPATQEASTMYRATRYCAAPVDRDDPPVGEAELEDEDVGEVSRIEVRTEELGHAVGVAARRRAGTGPVGLLLGDGLGATRFAAGLEASLDSVEVVEPDGVDDELDDDAIGAARATALLEQDVEVVVLDGGPGAQAALEVLAGSVTLLGPAVLLDADGFADDGLADDVVLAWQVSWADVLGPTIAALVEEDSGQRSFGFEDEVFTWSAGPAASVAIGAAVADAAREIAAGTRDPLAPPPAASLPPFGHGEDDDDTDDDEQGPDADDADDDQDG